MRKRFLLAAVLLLVIGGAAVFLAHRLVEREATLPAFSEQDFARAATNFDGALPAQPSTQTPIAVPLSKPVRLALGSLGLADDLQNRQLADLLTAELTGARGLELVER